MKAYVYRSAGDTYRLAVEERPTPTPGPDQVVVRVRATSLNYRDHITLHNLAKRKVDGRIPLSDGAGEIIAVGTNVTDWKPGDRVAGCFFQTWDGGRFDLSHHKQDLGGSVDGMLAEEVVLRAGGIVRIPDFLSFEEAACLPCAALTAWYSLTTRGGLQPGDTLLTLGTGGVSVFALQFGVALGAKVIITSSDDHKLARARSLGASHTVNYRTHVDWDKEVWNQTNGRGADHIIEVGGPGTLGRSMNAVAAGGTIALIGVLTGFGPPTESLFPLLGRNVSLNGIYVGSRADFEAMNRFLTEKTIRPVMDRVFGFSEAEAAFSHLASGSHFGKVVITVP
ncbi:MAG: NAD(P)-dependent alcohol dehydrogenase [Bacteroidales bacterium]|nr:NAD(P)-dependent alcohol dehydrogenase [Bacteroidales bacterium]